MADVEQPDMEEETDTDVEPASASDATADKDEALVEALSFGELDPPDFEGEDFGEPREFETPSLEAFGERDDEVDIEEID